MDGRHSPLVVVVVDVAGAKAERGSTRANVLPVVVGVCDMELARVLAGVAIAVANEGRLVVVVEVVAGMPHVSLSRYAFLVLESIQRDGDPVAAMGDVDETVIVVLVGGEIGVELVVVDPNIGAGLFNFVCVSANALSATENKNSSPQQ